MDDNNERSALRELQNEARQSRESAPSSSPGDGGGSAQGALLAAVLVVALGISYLAATDPCFEFKLAVTVHGPQPDALKIWRMDCQNDKGTCVCGTPETEFGCQTICSAREQPFEMSCYQVCKDPGPEGW